jgi:23S rRNA (adenine-N6)-dimethyltransferase
VPAGRRAPRDDRRRLLGQNFLRPELADRLVGEIGIERGELVVDIGAGSGALTLALARRGAHVLAVELDAAWVARLRETAARQTTGRIQVIHTDFLTWRLPTRPFRAVGCIPFGATTAIFHRLFDDPSLPLTRADLIVQWEVARKRAETPPSTLISTTWAPWWSFQLGRRIPARQFRPVPKVDGSLLVAARRDPALLPVAMAPDFADFVRERWPFPRSGTAEQRNNIVSHGRSEAGRWAT